MTKEIFSVHIDVAWMYYFTLILDVRELPGHGWYDTSEVVLRNCYSLALRPPAVASTVTPACVERCCNFIMMANCGMWHTISLDTMKHLAKKSLRFWRDVPLTQEGQHRSLTFQAVDQLIKKPLTCSPPSTTPSPVIVMDAPDECGPLPRPKSLIHFL